MNIFDITQYHMLYMDLQRDSIDDPLHQIEIIGWDFLAFSTPTPTKCDKVNKGMR